MFILPGLPYRPDALSPVMSAETLRFHHGKHHKTYVETLNALLDEAGENPASLEEVIRAAAGDAGKVKLLNNAAQAWNHGFFWEAMTPDSGKPEGALVQAIDAAFGDLATLRARLVKAGAEHFGSGWVWLAAEGDRVRIVTTHDATNLLTSEGVVPLTVCDVWEHAYYLDHQNDRKGFLEAWFDGLINWGMARSQFAAAQGRGATWTYPAAVEAPGTARRVKR